jgi:hypothetical protein
MISATYRCFIVLSLLWLIFILTLSHASADSSLAVDETHDRTAAAGNGGSAARSLFVASEVQAAVNSDLPKGGGIDDTKVLQAILDRAAAGTPVHLTIEGVALISGLEVFGNTTIECVRGGGLYLKDGSSRPLIQNKHRSQKTITDAHILIRGCFLNGNRNHQPGLGSGYSSDTPDGTSNQEPDGTFISGVQFVGVNDLVLEDLTIWNSRAMGAIISNASRVQVSHVIVDHGEHDGAHPGQTDGLDFKGPVHNVQVDHVILRTGDDAISLNADEQSTNWGPYIGTGEIVDVSIDHVQLISVWQGIRLLSSTNRIDRILIGDVSGTVRGHYFANLSHWVEPNGLGNFGSISIVNVNVARTQGGPAEMDEIIASLKKPKFAAMSKEWNGGRMGFISLSGHIKSLRLQNIATDASDDRPILRVGPEAHLRMLTADLTIDDPQEHSKPVEIDAGSEVDRLDLSLHWLGKSDSIQRNPIVSLGGRIGRLSWRK